jgi:Flp pilus assembly protein TadG
MKAKRAPGARRGQVLVLVALAMTVLLLIAGLVLDYGIWLVQERTMRNAADGAVQAGVSELVKRPITAAKQQNAATHAMEYLNDQLNLGLPPGQIATAASHALLDANGFGSEDGVPGYTGTDHYLIRTPVTATVSCTGATWGERALTVRVQHLAPRFLSRLLFSGDQPINVCATASLEGNGYAIAVLQPNSGTQPNNTNLTMRLGGTGTFITVCGGDVGINAIFSGGPQPPPNSQVQPAFVKFLKPNSSPACTIDNSNKMLMTVENPSPPSWNDTAKQVRVEGPTSALSDDLYQAPRHLPNYIQIPTWGHADYTALTTADALATPIIMRNTTPGNGTCTPPTDGVVQYSKAVAPGKYSLIEAGQNQAIWLCPKPGSNTGVYHFVKRAQGSPEGLQFGPGSFIGGQGVTLVFDTSPAPSGNTLNGPPLVLSSSGAGLLLNSPPAGGTLTPAPWLTGDPNHNVPIAIWVKPSDTGTPLLSLLSSSSIDVDANPTLNVRGIIFGPTDNMKISGNGSQSGAGEIWAWTIVYTGNSVLEQVYEGDDDGYPLIVE